jgi:hypothetical protein
MIPNYCKACGERSERAGFCGKQACTRVERALALAAEGAETASHEASKDAFMSWLRPQLDLNVSLHRAFWLEVKRHPHDDVRHFAYRWKTGRVEPLPGLRSSPGTKRSVFRRDELLGYRPSGRGTLTLADLMMAVFPRVLDDALVVDESPGKVEVHVREPAAGVDYSLLSRQLADHLPVHVAVVFSLGRFPELPAIKDDNLRRKLEVKRLTERDLDRASGAQLDIVARDFGMTRINGGPTGADINFREFLRAEGRRRGRFAPP